ncbi:hypothetical protein RF11_00810 [Thelohanellus kitauei]|uniref:Uncharacterized protein n=1 Tax=Thelohanellus kitauei TaxID=669202 RepID=A0A0C2MDF6_THEKT|nr:hypothetical protein RF11_00810 [Thelohanellus kitauei]
MFYTPYLNFDLGFRSLYGELYSMRNDFIRHSKRSRLLKSRSNFNEVLHDHIDDISLLLTDSAKTRYMNGPACGLCANGVENVSHILSRCLSRKTLLDKDTTDVISTFLRYYAIREYGRKREFPILPRFERLTRHYHP